MEELIARITSKVGIDAATAEKAVGMILAFLQKEGPAAEVQKLSRRSRAAASCLA
jgi:hypothetical protein